MKYKSVIVTLRGGPEVLKVVENDLRPPSPGEARVKILATQVCAPDVSSRYGATPFAPRVPFVPGYAAVGVVDALGLPKQGPHTAAMGDRVAVLSVFGGCAEYIYGAPFIAGSLAKPASERQIRKILRHRRLSF